MPGTHALLSASSSARWLQCAPSARAESTEPSKDTVFTVEGTLAHAIGEAYLNFYKSGRYNTVRDFDEIRELPWNDIPELVGIYDECNKNGLDFWDMAETVYEGYVRFIIEDWLAAKAAYEDVDLFVEARLKLDEFIPEGFGTSDAVLIFGDTLKIYDLKYGKGVKVEANQNSQMMCYGLGALYGPGEPYLVNTVVMTIIQPRLHHVSVLSLPAPSLVNWGYSVLKPAASKAFSGQGPYVPGPHCHFCRVAARCNALRRYTEYVQTVSGEPALLTLTELGDALRNLDILKAYVNAVESYALGKLLEGSEIPGWKLVEGRSVRKIVNEQDAVARLVELGWDEDQCYKPRELRTISELEKMVGKKNFTAVLGDFIDKPKGKPTLALADDPRDAYQVNTAENDFADLV